MFALENVALQFSKLHTDELLHEQINVGADIADAVGGGQNLGRHADVLLYLNAVLLVSV